MTATGRSDLDEPRHERSDHEREDRCRDDDGKLPEQRAYGASSRSRFGHEQDLQVAETILRSGKRNRVQQ